VTRLRLGRTKVEDRDDDAAPTRQVEQRRRRRARQAVVYDGGFNLATEVADIVTPLAERIAAEPVPAVWWSRVAELAEGTHAAVVAVADLLAEADGLRRTRHLPVEQRGRAVALVREQAKAHRPDAPVVTEAELVAGSWAAVLTELAHPYSEPLADLLRHAVRPGTTRGRLTASEQVETALRLIDTPAIGIRNTLDTAAAGRVTHKAPRPVRRSVDEIEAELAELGVAP
jgi:hypothetical protein